VIRTPAPGVPAAVESPAPARETPGAPAADPRELLVSQFRLVPVTADTFAKFKPRANVSEKEVASPALGVHEVMNLSSVWPRLGYCRRGQSLIPQIPDSVCDWRACVEVDGTAYNVDRLLLGRQAAVE
ncbi:unnamed protein product, partial [Prorocentrum cordatum]